MVKTLNIENRKIINSDNTSKERALLIFINFKSRKKKFLNKHKNKFIFDENVNELKNLAVSAGAYVSDVIIHNQNRINPKYFISIGKLNEIKNKIYDKGTDLIIFDEEITPAQQSNLQNKLDIKVIDRTALILDIFVQRARSREGKIQVELAQLNYLLPRLTGKGIQLSRLAGGIGIRGPGETKLEVDRRKIRKRITQLDKKINQIVIQRDIQRKKREENKLFLASIVGYTNSGKSTLLNAITDSNVYVRDMLFSTLDSTTRKSKILSGNIILISDTVGFIEKLPHQLIASFKSTLEEVRKSDLLLLLADINNPNYEGHISSVSKVLKDIDIHHKPAVLIFNKIDKIDKERLKEVKIKYKNAVFISALKKIGFKNLNLRIKKIFEKDNLTISVKIPYNENKLISFVYDNCKVLDKKYLEDSVVLFINADLKIYNKLSKYIYKNKSD
jgi:GTP-binding protein HflX